MTPNKPEGSRLTPDEALEDVQRFNKAAETEGLPKMNQYANIGDVKTAEDLLQESGAYSPKEHKFFTLTEINEAIGGIESTSPKFNDMRDNLLIIADGYIDQWEIDQEAREIINEIKSVPYGSTRNLFMKISQGHAEFMKKLKLQAGGQRQVPLRPAGSWGEPRPHDHGWISTPGVRSRELNSDKDRAAATLALLNALVELMEAKWGSGLINALRELRVAVFFHTEAQKAQMTAQINNTSAPGDRRRLTEQKMALSGYKSVENLEREIDGVLRSLGEKQK